MTQFDSWDSYFVDNPREQEIAEDQRVLRNLLGATDPPAVAVSDARPERTKNLWGDRQRQLSARHGTGSVHRPVGRALGRGQRAARLSGGKHPQPARVLLPASRPRRLRLGRALPGGALPG